MHLLLQTVAIAPTSSNEARPVCPGCRRPEPEPSIFGGKAKEKRGGNAVRCEELIRENETFSSIDLVKERLSHACKLTDEAEMGNETC